MLVFVSRSCNRLLLSYTLNFTLTTLGGPSARRATWLSYYTVSNWYNIKMEKVNFLPNGQWTLEKAEPKNMDHYKFGNRNPDYKITDADAAKHQDMAYQKALAHSKHSVRNMLNDKGELEDHIMLHRGIGNYNPEATTGHNAMKISPTHIESDDTNVHTLLPHVAKNYSYKYPTDEEGEEIPDGTPTKGKVLSFWVPKSKVHYMGGYLGEGSVGTDEHAESQKHTSIMPGKFKRATPEEVSLVSKYKPEQY